MSSFLKEVRFTKQEFSTSTSISNLKYYYPGLQNNNLFYPFYNQLDYILAFYFVESKTTNGNIDKFLSKLYIPNNEWIKHKFELQNSVAGVARREIAIHLQNRIGCFEFLMSHPGF